MRTIAVSPMIIFFVCIAGISMAQEPVIALDAVIAFDGVVPYSNEYTVDVSGDGVSDVVFSTSSPGGFGTKPGTLEGGIISSGPELTIQFPGGATGSLTFDFGVTQPHETRPEVQMIVRHPTDPFRFVTAQVDTDVEGSGTLSITLTDGGGPFTAEMASLCFCSGGGGSRYFIDNFSGTFGAALPLNGCGGDIAPLTGDGYVDGLDLAAFAVGFEAGDYDEETLSHLAAQLGSTDCFQ